MTRTVTLLHEDFAGIAAGMFSVDVGAHTEYHFLPEAAPRGGWSVACFGTRPAGREWRIVETEGAHAMEQTLANTRAHTHPMVCAGDFLWGDYTVTVRFRPQEGQGRCGVVFRYHNNRCYYFFGFDGRSVVLLLVRHEKEFRVPAETLLASTPAVAQAGVEYTAVVEARGPRFRCVLQGVAELEAEDSTYAGGKVALLSDRPALFLSVDVQARQPAARAWRALQSRQQRELEELRALYPRPVLWKRIGTRGFGVGRNLRFGDLDGDGRLEILVAQVDHQAGNAEYSETACLTALDLDGRVLWQSGDPDPEKYHLVNDVAVQVHDIDGDGRAEVVYARASRLVVADGTTGRVLREAPTPVSKPPADKRPRILGDCLFFCDMRGTGRPADIVIKDRYWHFWVYDDELRPLWEADCNTGHYPYAFDVDGDGRDELAMGYSLFDHDGRLMWTLDDRLKEHVDGVAVVNFGESPGSQPRILYAASDEGLLFLDLQGRILKHHRIGHAQNPVIGRFRADLPGLQTITINFWGNQGILHFFDAAGDVYHDAEPLNMGSMCLPVNWSGDDTELFALNPHPSLGGLFDGWGRPVVSFPDDGHPVMCNASIDLTGDCRDEIVVWDPNEIWIYTQDDNPRRGRLYRPVRNPLWNASNYFASVSLPGWSEGAGGLSQVRRTPMPVSRS